jgi:hypothetical protein
MMTGTSLAMAYRVSIELSRILEAEARAQARAFMIIPKDRPPSKSEYSVII